MDGGGRDDDPGVSIYLYTDAPIRRFPQNALIGRADPIRKALGFAAKEKKSRRN